MPLVSRECRAALIWYRMYRAARRVVRVGRRPNEMLALAPTAELFRWGGGYVDFGPREAQLGRERTKQVMAACAVARLARLF
jgi:hypothetical protein